MRRQLQVGGRPVVGWLAMITERSATVVGIDLGDKNHVICAVQREGCETVDERTITSHRESLRRLSLKHPGR